MKIKLLIIGAIALAASSCSAPKNTLAYFQNIEDITLEDASSIKQAIKIEPNDELYISVTSMVPTATAIYNLPASNPAMVDRITSATTPTQQTYIVDGQGDIDFPVLGKIHVAGLTTTQLTEDLTRRISRDVEDPVVRVELVSMKIAVLGEVSRPGQIGLPSQRFTLLDALARAGDLTAYGERDHVLLMREVDGKREYHTFNLNDAATLNSPYFYLKQNDVIYVYPNKIRQSNARYDSYKSYRIQVASAIVSAASVIASLVIALSVK